MNKIKKIIDGIMSIILIPLMAYQVTGEALHEWFGVSMVILLILHQIINRKWYQGLFKGSYKLFRIFSVMINLLLLISFALTAISGVSMSNHAVPFLYNLINVNTARVMHLAFSYLAFIFMGLHIGMHINVMMAKIQIKIKSVLAIIFTVVSGYGFYLFIKSGIINYITFKTHFAFLDYEKAAILVFIENICMITFFIFIGHNVSNIIKEISKKDNSVLKRLIYIMLALIIGFIINMLFGQNLSDSNSWQNASLQNFEMIESKEPELNNLLKDSIINNNIETKDEKGRDMNLYIDNKKVDVEWEDNNSVKELKEIIKNKGLIINTHQYGGFEQVGEIGQSIVSNNTEILAEPGDIVLYNDSNIVLFYGSNMWSYTKLGKIVGKTNEELKSLLDKNSIELKIN